MIALEISYCFNAVENNYIINVDVLLILIKISNLHLNNTEYKILLQNEKCLDSRTFNVVIIIITKYNIAASATNNISKGCEFKTLRSTEKTTINNFLFAISCSIFLNKRYCDFS